MLLLMPVQLYYLVNIILVYRYSVQSTCMWYMYHYRELFFLMKMTSYKLPHQFLFQNVFFLIMSLIKIKIFFFVNSQYLVTKDEITEVLYFFIFSYKYKIILRTNIKTLNKEIFSFAAHIINTKIFD